LSQRYRYIVPVPKVNLERTSLNVGCTVFTVVIALANDCPNLRELRSTRILYYDKEPYGEASQRALKLEDRDTNKIQHYGKGCIFGWTMKPFDSTTASPSAMQ